MVEGCDYCDRPIITRTLNLFFRQDDGFRKTQGLGAKKSRKRKKGWLRRHFKIAVLLACVTAVAIASNWIYQVWRKPSELIGVFDNHFHKHPEKTWESYRPAFRAKATYIVTPDLLAALAQAETNGNPVARTYWKFRWTTDIKNMFAPASSAVGMFQITEGTFKEARQFCIRDGRAVRTSENESCRSSAFSRLLPAHAIEMTSARLHWHVENLMRRHGVRKASLRDKQNLATIIHLCGLGKGERLVRAQMRLTRIGRCGDHDPVAYVRRVSKLQREFQKLAAREAYIAQGD